MYLGWYFRCQIKVPAALPIAYADRTVALVVIPALPGRRQGEWLAQTRWSPTFRMPSSDISDPSQEYDSRCD
jgi:hypothetical protein